MLNMNGYNIFLQKVKKIKIKMMTSWEIEHTHKKNIFLVIMFQISWCVFAFFTWNIRQAEVNKRVTLMCFILEHDRRKYTLDQNLTWTKWLMHMTYQTDIEIFAPILQCFTEIVFYIFLITFSLFTFFLLYLQLLYDT